MSKIGDFFRALGALWKFGSALAPLFEQLPNMMPIAGDAMILSGDSAIFVSKTLKKANGDPVNAQSLVEGISTSLQFCEDSVQGAVNQLNAIAHELNHIKIPIIKPLTISLLGADVVVGFEPAFDTPFFPIRDGFTQTANLLGALSQQLDQGRRLTQQLGQALGNSGANLQTVGTALKTCGQAFKDSTSA